MHKMDEVNDNKTVMIILIFQSTIKQDSERCHNFHLNSFSSPYRAIMNYATYTAAADDKITAFIIIMINFFCVNILEDQSQWCDKTKGLSKLVIVRQCVSRQWMDGDARKDDTQHYRYRFIDVGGMKLYYLLI